MNELKRLSVLFLVQFVCMLVSAQYEPNTKWPYLYDNFTDGTIYFQGNSKHSAKLNIHLDGNVLHYIADDGKVYENTTKNVVRVEIGKDAYIYSDKQVMQIISVDETNILALLVRGDFNSLLSGSGAYGSSLNTSATRQLSSLDLGGLDTPEHGKLLQEKNDGKIIPTVKEYYLIIGGKTIRATKSAVLDYLGDEKKASFKSFLKENKISWKSAESLSTLLKYFNQQ